MSENPTHDGTMPPVPSLPSDRCPRCGGPFQCGMGGPGPCACTRIRLDDATLASLRQQYIACLCLDCLAALSVPGSSTDIPADIPADLPSGTTARIPGPEPR